ncbi:TonB-dependent receptor [Alteromonas sp. C1M14]|uniref:TonB-dependent receptor n=1 Tax=Alteromonas sp. C1M14 TaxID=2841567 RepID=UPI001C095817|nr:TonB-dependent receptor [Alteromonas sp. C1M14]MBU2979303.1 TonB-dependent receptor [Alteromonas sp. C1M14]
MSKKHRNAVSRISPHLFLSLSVACACQSVSAQELERITVRAQYKEEDLQTVPIAITALSEKDIELRNMQDSMSLNEAVPNINVAKNVGASSGMKVFLRGIGEDESRAGVDPAVGVYVDDVYIGRQTGALLDLADIQSLEVLRGPQGTLYGRNSNGGAIRVTTKQPTLSDQTVLKTSIGSSDLVQGYLMVNKALTDKLAGQVAVFSKSRQGFITNTDTGDQLGDVDRLGARVATRYYGDTWDIQWSADFLRDNSDPGYPTRPEDANSDLFVINQAMFPLGGTINGDTELGEFYNHLYQSGTSLKAHRELDNGVSVESLTSYRRLTQQMLTIVSLTFFQDIAQNQFSQEVRFAKDTDDYSWVSGVFLFREDADQFTQYIFGSADIDLLTESAAVFGQYTYNVNDRLHLTGGLRYTWESKEFDADASDDYWSSLAQTNEGLSEETWGNLSWKGVVGYDFSEDAFGYLSVTTGFKSGGWSPDSFAVVDDESVVTYEVGVKSDISKALRLNVNAFYNDYTNLQVSGTTPNGFTRLNAGDVETYGVEASVTWQATEDLTIDAYVGTLEAKYVTITEEALAFIDKSSELKQAPPLSYGVNFNYATEVGEGQLIYNVQYSYTDKQYNDLSNSEIISRKATDILNGRIAYKWGTEVEYNVALWVKNAFDEEYAAAGTSGTVYPGDPRTYGLDFSFNF